MQLSEIFNHTPKLIIESVSFGGIQTAIYDYVLKNMKNIPSEAKYESENDRFWVHEFDDVYAEFKADHIDSVIDTISYAIEAVSHAIVDYYGNSLNHPPGFKPIKLKPLENPSTDDLIAIVAKLDPNMVERDKEEAKKNKREIATKSSQKKHIEERIKDIVKMLKKTPISAWNARLKDLKSNLQAKTLTKYMISDMFPKGTKIEQLELIKSKEDLKALFIKPTDILKNLAYNLELLSPSDEEEYLIGLCYVAARSPVISKKIVDML